MKFKKALGSALVPLLFAAALLLTVPMAQAQPGPGGPGGPGHGPGMGPGVPMEEIDTNNDGRISQEEIDAYVKKQVGEIDADHNGKISIKELQSYEERRRAAMLEKRYLSMDSNHDGVVSVEEYEQALKARLERPAGGPEGPGGMPPRQ